MHEANHNDNKVPTCNNVLQSPFATKDAHVIVDNEAYR